MIDYDLTKIKGIVFDVDGVLSPTVIPMYPDGEPMRMVNVKDGYAMQLAVKKGLLIAILSGARTHAVQVRFENLGVSDVLLGVPVKLPVFEQWMSTHGLKAEQVAYVGDDIPDLQVMHAAGRRRSRGAAGSRLCEPLPGWLRRGPRPAGAGDEGAGIVARRPSCIRLVTSWRMPGVDSTRQVPNVLTI